LTAPLWWSKFGMMGAAVRGFREWVRRYRSRRRLRSRDPFLYK